MKIVIDIHEKDYQSIKNGHIPFNVLNAIMKGTPLPKQQTCEDCRNCKKWEYCPCGKEGHENGTSIGYSIGECKEYEQQPCEDCISREAVMSALFDLWEPTEYNDEDEFLEYLEKSINRLPSVTPKPNFISKDVLDKIRAEIEFEVDHRTNMLCAEDVFEIIDKYKTESEDEK